MHRSPLDDAARRHLVGAALQQLLLQLLPRLVQRRQVGGAVRHRQGEAHGRLHRAPLLPRLLRPSTY